MWTARSRSSAARISGRLGRTEPVAPVVTGGGCLVGPLEVVTCAHVVNDALGRGDDESRPEEPVLVDFPLLGVEHAPVGAHVVSWSHEHDVAGLRLAVPPPAAARPAPLLFARHLWDHEFGVFGFPDGYDMGTWATGRILDVNGKGWLQVENTGAGGRVIAPGYSGAAVWLTGEGAVIGIVVADDRDRGHRTGFVIPADLLVRVWPELANPPAAPPFRGTEVFGEEDAELFFGREEESQELAARALTSGLTAVLGPSGCGKSSLLRAGVLPILRRDPAVLALLVRPARAATPCAALAAALLAELEPELSESARLAELPVLESALRDGGLPEAAARARGKAGRDRLVLLVDQFEDVCGDPAAAAEFAAAVLPLLRAPGAAAHLLLTLRTTDLPSDPPPNAEFAALLRDRCHPVGPLSGDALRLAIEEPLAPTGVRMEPGLLRDVLDDLGEQPGRMPPAQLTLASLWERRHGGMLTQAAYDEVGGVRGTIAAHAEKVWTERLSPADRARAGNLLLQLVRQAPDRPPAAVPLRRSSVDEETWRLGQDLAAARLLVAADDPPGTPTLRLAHESLLTGWERLRAWIQDDTEFRVWHHDLRQAAERWHDLRREADLPTGPRLAEALAWAERRREDLSGPDRKFLAAAREAATRAARRRRLTLALRWALPAAAAVLAAVAVHVHAQSENRLRTLAARTLASRAEDVNASRDLSILNALAAYRSDPEEPSALRALFSRYADYADTDLLLPGSGVTSARVMASEDGAVVAQEESHGVRVWRPGGGGEVTGRLLRVADGVLGSALNARGTRLAVAVADGTVELWDPRTSQQTDRIEVPGIVPEERVLLGFDATGDRLLIHDPSGNAVIVWDGRQRAIRLPGLAGREIKTLRMSADGVVSAYAATLRSGLDNWLLVAEGAGPFRRAYTLAAAAKGVTALGHDGRTLVTCRDVPGGTLLTTFDVRTGRERSSGRLPRAGCASVPEPATLSHGGRLLLLPRALVDVTARDLIGGPAVSGESPVVTGRDGAWSIWDVGRFGVFRTAVGRRVDTGPHTALATAVVGDAYVVTVDDDDRVRVWDTKSGLLRGERAAHLREDAGGPPPGEGGVRVVAVRGRQEVVLARSDTRELVLLSVPDLRPLGSKELPAPAARAPDGVPSSATPAPDEVPFSLHAQAGGGVVAFAGGLVSRWETTPLRLAGPPLDVRATPSDGLTLLPGDDGTSALLVTPAARRVQRYDLTLGRLTRTYVLPGRGPGIPVAASGDLARLVVHNGDDRDAFSLWNLPPGGPPAAGPLAGLYRDGDAYDLLRLRQENEGLDVDADFTVMRIGDALGHVTMFPGGGRLLYRTGQVRVLSTEPADWARHLCAVSGGRRFTPEERSALPDGTNPEPCT